MIHDLIDQASYMAHGYCLLWKPWLVAVHAGSDLVIALSYFAIPLVIAMFIAHRPSLELKRLAWMFAAFITWCGITHLVNILTLWWPIYETQGIIKLATAGISAFTAFSMFPLLPKALAVPSPRELQVANARLMREIEAHQATLLELRAARRELEERVEARTRQLSEQKQLSDALVQISSQIVWTADANGKIVERQPGWESFTGQAFDAYSGDGWLAVVHPDDRARIALAWTEANAQPKPEPVRFEYRLKDCVGTWHWVDVHGAPLFDDAGKVRGWVGMHQDITSRKQHDEHITLLMRELSHRAKNLLAVCLAMARQTARQSESLDDFVERFANRLQGLARSHDLLVQGDWSGAPISSLIETQLSPFVGAQSPRVVLSGPEVQLEPRATETVGLVLHELATNAAKYGALSLPAGIIHLSWSIDQDSPEGPLFEIVWLEQGGPPVSLPRRRGFGTMVIDRMIADAVNGTVTLDYRPEGLVWRLQAPLKRIVR